MKHPLDRTIRLESAPYGNDTGGYSICCHLSGAWANAGHTYARGALFRGDSLLRAGELAASFDRVPLDHRVEWLRESNGFFALVNISPEGVLAAADTLRTVPLFYGARTGCFYLSDDAYWLADALDERETDHAARLELLLTGFVTADDTLCPNVKQLQAGEIVSISATERGIPEATRLRYHRSCAGAVYASASESDLLTRYEDVLARVFLRLVRIADGRTIVVPLSGGYDSRLIVSMLKRLGYDRLVAFSYGIPGNSEASVSQLVAERLGIKWFFVPYSDESWADWFLSDSMQRYLRTSNHHCTIPHIQDWPAVSVLTRERLIPENALVVPGLSGDLPSGGFSKKFPMLYCESEFCEQLLLRTLARTQSSLWDCRRRWPELESFLFSRVCKSLGPLAQYRDMACALESWVACERVAKYVNNSVRAYEFWGHDWWLPLWDREFAGFWGGVEPRHRTGQLLYRRHLAQAFSETAGIPVSEAASRSSEHAVIGFLRARLKGSALWSYLRRGHMVLFDRRRTHFLRWYGFIPDGIYRRYRDRATSVVSYLALMKLELISPETGGTCQSLDHILKDMLARLHPFRSGEDGLLG